MNPAGIFIRQPVTCILLSLSLLVFGLMGYFSLPISDLPNVDYPTIRVSAVLPGADPETMASSVAAPLEARFCEIAGLESMNSTSSFGKTSINLQFKLDRHIDAAAQDVQSAISRARLPSNLPDPPTYTKVNPADAPILYLLLDSPTLPLSTVNEYARTLITQRVSTINGVARVDVYGEQKHAVRIQLDPNALAARSIGIDQVQAAVSAQNVMLPTGVLEGERRRLTIKAHSQLDKAALYGPLIVTSRDGCPVRLQDLGQVVDGVELDKSSSWWNGKRCIVLAVQRQPGSNTVEVVDAIKKLLPGVRTQLPAGIDLQILYDASHTIRESVADVKLSLMLAIGLVVAVVFLFLRSMSATLITSLVVPLSLMGTFAAMVVLGYSLNNLSLMALILSVGFVVDDAIVVLENIVCHLKMGKKPLHAALDGAGEIGFTVVSITLSLVVVFVPIIFMSGVLGRLLKEFGVTIAVAVLLSGFVSLSLVPMLCSIFLRNRSQAGEERSHEERRGLFALALRLYDRSLGWVLDHRSATLLGATVLLCATIYLFMVIPKGFIPSEDRGYFLVFTRADQGISYELMTRRQNEIGRLIKEDPDVEGVLSMVGTNPSLNSGQILAVMKPRAMRQRSVDESIVQLRSKAADVCGILAFPTNPPMIKVGARSSKAACQLTLQSTNTAELHEYARNLEARLAALPQIVDVNSDLMMDNPEAILDIDRDRASMLGVTVRQIEDAFYSAYSNREISIIYAPDDMYKVILELLPRYRRDPGSLEALYVRAATGKLVPLAVLAGVREGRGALQINHTGQLPSVTLSFNVKSGVSLGEAIEAVKKQASKILPATIAAGFTGTAQAFEESMASLFRLLFLALLLVYVILGILYQSFIHPITILAGLPSAALGALITLLVFKSDLNLYGFVGIVMLIGIVKKNSIMMIDFALDAERNHALSARESIRQGCLIRLRPIMMTTVAAFAGTLPIALGLGAGADARRSLGLAVCGGLVVSQLVTLFITPVIYTCMDEARAWFAGRWKAS